MLGLAAMERPERTILALPIKPGTSIREEERRKNEAVSLLETYGAHVVASIAFTLKGEDSAFLIGPGQTGELKEDCLFFEADSVCFDCALRPRTQRNLEEVLGLPVMDRNELIIEIFSQRAHSREARLQTALAKAQMLLPRLKQRGAAFAQQRGGVRGAKGEGETRIELDRRHLEEVITTLKKEIALVRRQRETQRKKRMGGGIASFALVGYTNAGKSSLMSALTGKEAFAEDKLFATLDTLARRLSIAPGLDVLLFDTVGFVSNLPHSLIDAFASTLEEAALADVLIIVLDSSADDIEEQMETTDKVLAELGAEGKPRIMVLNKIDKESANEVAFRRVSLAAGDAIAVSAKTGEGLPLLKERMKELALPIMGMERKTIALCDSSAIEAAYKTGRIVSADYGQESVTFLLRHP